ncbi:hypothetical protein Rhopal_005246-T1 [Rhodotorula paludigena]|uniref:Mitochondrial carrier protein n=1 Tax=Rhodotorula paludigena TaxID=86838 RepID=A0AAV5GRT3_9BASI|nr:hypothetical protein Rhopal_005246-T1 [Rhodotorula paludigena]
MTAAFAQTAPAPAPPPSQLEHRAVLPAALQPPVQAATSRAPAAAPSYILNWTPDSPWRHIPLPPASAFFVVSPLERLKIILQVQGSAAQYQGVWHGLRKMWREEGFRGYMRGNGINVLRIAPYSAVQFSSYELFKGTLQSPDGSIDTPRRLLAGSLAGICSVVSTYPLDLVRSRLSVESASLGMKGGRTDGRSSGIVGMTLRVMREEGGVKALYRGLVPTCAKGVAPYVAFNFAAYELLKLQITSWDPHHEPPGTLAKLVCGGVAGAISQTLTYPADLLRRRMQMVGLKDQALGYEYTGAWNAVATIIRNEGLRGLYKGIWPNLLKCGPAMATSFATYEVSKDFIDDWQREHERKHERNDTADSGNR